MEIIPFPLEGLASGKEVTKAALLPYRRRQEGIEICLMQPVGKRKELGDPLYEICKGTRMWRMPDGAWAESKTESRPGNATPEPLEITALREAGEELNLDLDMIIGMRDADVQPFYSTSNPEERKEMRLYLAELAAGAEIEAPNPEISGTERVDWFRLSEVRDDPRIRPDHRAILIRLAEKSVLLGAE